MRMEIGDLLAVEHDVGRVAGVGQFEILVQREFLGRGRGAVFCSGWPGRSIAGTDQKPPSGLKVDGEFIDVVSFVIKLFTDVFSVV